MKLPLASAALGIALLAFAACQNGSHQAPNDFGQKTRRTYNPQTGSFEQMPPYGKQSNKSDDQH